MTAFALVLFLGAAAAWIAAGGAPARAQVYLRLAAVLYAALAISEAADVAAAAVTDIAATLGSAVLGAAAYAAFRRSPRVVTASVMLLIAAVCGIGAAATDWRAMAAVPQVASAVCVFLIARPGLWRRASLYLALASLCLLGAAASALTAGTAARAGLLLFAAAATLGVAVGSNLGVEPERTKGRRPRVSRAR